MFPLLFSTDFFGECMPSIKSIKTLNKNHYVLVNLIKSDFKNRYLGNHLGVVWAFIQPLIMTLVYWFVFTKGFRSTPISNAPFLLWLLMGLVPWFLISDAIISGANSIVAQSFLVKKIVFEVKLLPLVKIGSAVLANLAFWLILFICLLAYGYYPGWNWLYIIYYMFCIICLVSGASLLLSAIMVFMLDVGQFVSIFIQIMFWATPIFWNQAMLPESLAWVIKLNPFAYIIDGLRDALIYNLPFWNNYSLTIYFWVFTIGLFYVGNLVFTRLRPHFADVL